MSNVVPINQKALSLVPQQNAFSAVMTVVPPKKKQFGGKKRKGSDGYVSPRMTLTPEELQRVLEAAKNAGMYGERDYCLILLAYRHALRCNEISKLHWDEIDLAKKEIYIYRSKGGQPNVHPLADDEIAALNRLADHRGYVFKSQQGGNLGERGIFKIVQRAGRNAKLGFDIGTHIFRHTKITQLVKRKFHAFTIQNFAGHRDIKATMRYVHEFDNDFEGMTDD